MVHYTAAILIIGYEHGLREGLKEKEKDYWKIPLRWVGGVGINPIFHYYVHYFFFEKKHKLKPLDIAYK